MNNNYIFGDPTPIREMLSGPFTLIDIGDSITDRQQLQWISMFPGAVPFGGFIMAGGVAIGQDNGGAHTVGAFGTTALMGSGNYSLFQSIEKTFNGTAYGVNANAGWNRFFYNTYPIAYAGTASAANRASGNYGGLLDWLAGHPFTRESIYYADGAPPAVLQDGCYRDSDKAGYNAFTSAALAASGFTHVSTPCSAISVAAADDVFFVSRIADNGVPANGQRIALCCHWARRTDPCWQYGSMVVGGTIVDNYLDPTRISTAAWGMLSLIGATHVRIAFGQNENDNLTQAQYTAKLLALIGLVRSANATIAIILVSQYQTSGATPAKLVTLAGAMKQVALTTPRTAFLDMNGLLPNYAAISSYIVDGTHPTTAGCTFFRGAEISLMVQLAGGLFASPAGRYAAQIDIEDLFGHANVAAWAQNYSNTSLDSARIQRALDYADATIDDFFRNGPYQSPLQLGASKATVAAWAATFAGVRLYRSRTTDAAGGTAPFTASVSITGGTSVSASVGQTADPYAALLADVRSQMSRCRAGAWRIDAAPAIPIAANAPAVAV